MDTNAITTQGALVAPNGNAEIADALCAYIHKRKNEIREQIAAVKVGPNTWNSDEVKSALKSLKDAIEDLRDKGKRLVADVCAATDAQRVLSQIDSRLWSFKAKADPMCAYAVLDAEYKALKARVDEFKAAALPPMPKHTYVAKITATDAQLQKLAKAAQNEGVDEFFYASAQSDKAVKQIAAWFKENAEEGCEE